MNRTKKAHEPVRFNPHSYAPAHFVTRVAGSPQAVGWDRARIEMVAARQAFLTAFLDWQLMAAPSPAEVREEATATQQALLAVAGLGDDRHGR